MPPKRKASSSHLDESPAKRSAPSTAVSSSTPIGTPGRATRSSDKLADIPSTPVTTTKVVKTYQGRRSTRKTPLGSLKENEKLRQSDVDKDSNDELDLLSPTKAAAKDILKQAPSVSPLEILTPARRTRSGKEILETPVHKKREGKRSTLQKQTSEQIGEASSFEPIGLPESPITATTTRSGRHKSPAKPQGITSARISPRKKPFATTNDSNVGQSSVQFSKSRERSPCTQKNTVQSTPNLRKRGRTAHESSTSPSKRQKTPDYSSSKIVAGHSNPSQSPLAPSLKFDAVVIPRSSTPIKPAIQRSAAPRALTPDLLHELPSATHLEAENSTIVLPSVRSPLDTASVLTPPSSPTKKKDTNFSSLARLPKVLPDHLHPCLYAQKRAILKAAQCPSHVGVDESNEEEPCTNDVAAQQLTSLLNGTITRGEGNSCLVLGPRGSGKSRLVEHCISSFSEAKPFVLRLSGWTQHSDRLAMREIAYQLSQQTGTSFLSEDISGEMDEAEEPYSVLDSLASNKMLSASQLPSLISVLPTLDRPTIVILDGFDLFTLHPRQALLYCLLDTAQSCRAAVGTQGIAIIGVTSRIDSVVHLEKRVKSRFSGRMIRTAPPSTLQMWEAIARSILLSNFDDFIDDELRDDDNITEWHEIWTIAVEQFLQDSRVQKIWNETFSITRDIRMFSRILTRAILPLAPSSFSLSPSQLNSAATIQRIRPHFSFLHTLPYPAICLLIASYHAEKAGQSTFTFEMLHEHFRDQVRASTSAPVQVRGGSIGMVRCSRQVLMIAFEDLVEIKAFVSVAAYTPSVAKEFVKYRSVIERESLKKAVDKAGQVNLKKWLSKAG
ncbi:hypothetical protein H0H92_009074 [Tricholoma furcatifolium]|nr:hypothetical protein H0H92_009074 [Tricholoma furcatifolium]